MPAHQGTCVVRLTELQLTSSWQNNATDEGFSHYSEFHGSRSGLIIYSLDKTTMKENKDVLLLSKSMVAVDFRYTRFLWEDSVTFFFFGGGGLLRTLGKDLVSDVYSDAKLNSMFK